MDNTVEEPLAAGLDVGVGLLHALDGRIELLRSRVRIPQELGGGAALSILRVEDLIRRGLGWGRRLGAVASMVFCALSQASASSTPSTKSASAWVRTTTSAEEDTFERVWGE